MKNLYSRLQNDGSLYALQGMFIFIILFAITGAVFGVVKVSIFEQSPSGRYAVYKECDDKFAVPDEPCDIYKTSEDSLGNRIKDQAKFYALIFGGVGIAAGMIYGDSKWRKKQIEK